MKKVLVLGAGFVSKPLVEYLLKRNYEVTVASRTVSKAKALVKGYSNGIALQLNITDESKLNNLISNCDLVISLVPYTYHVQIAHLCLKHKKHLITTSYVSAEMQELHAEASKANLTFLNEIGLDPGIDHMSAMKLIHEAHAEGGKIISFKSYCGGLPAKQNDTNPFGYKFSWSPRGVIMAGRNNGQYLENSKIVFIPGRELFTNYEILDIDGVGTFEAYTNRNALPYKSLYEIDEAETVFRGTLRNVGWCYTMKKINELGLLDDSVREDLEGLTFHAMLQKLTGSNGSEHIIDTTANFLGLERHSTVIKRLEWLGLFSDARLPITDNVMDVFVRLLEEKLVMEPGEVDLIILHHKFIISYKNRKEILTSTLAETGIPESYSAMSRTVSLPAAIAAALLLEGKISAPGVHIPVQSKIYTPVLKELEKTGLKFSEKSFKLK